MQRGGMYGLPIDTYLLANESLITRARNHICDIFLRSEAEHLMFWDADVGCQDPMDVFGLLILQVQNPQYGVIGGRYRRKAIGAGWAACGLKEFDLDARNPVAIPELCSGFMMVHRGVFERVANYLPKYRPDTSPGDGQREITQFFQAEIDQTSGRYLSEDFWFSHRCNEIGIQTWLCPWMKLRHAGTFVFE